MKKKLFTIIVNWTGILWVCLHIRKIIPRKGFMVLCYHRVLDIRLREFGLMHGVVDATVRDFDAQMKFLSKHYNVMTLSQLISRLKSKSLPGNSVAITFDDAYKDIYTNAFPILKKYGLPATVFVCADYIGPTENLYWWDYLAYIVKNTKKKKFTIKLNGVNRTFDLSNYQARLKVNKELNSFIKRNLDNAQRKIILDNVKKSLAINIPLSVTKDLFLNIKDIKDLLNNGFEFGSHTITHPTLTSSTHDELEREIVDSKKVLEEKISSPVSTFAYPSGVYNDKCKEYAKKANYECACSYDYGINNYETDLFEIKRIDINSDVNINSFKAQMVFPTFMNYSSSKKQKKKTETGISGLAQAIKLKGWDNGLNDFINASHPSRRISILKSSAGIAAAWKYLINFTGNEKRALIMENGLGGVTCSLAKHYEEIHCIHNVLDNIECIKSNVENRKIKNVFFLQISDFLNYPYKYASFDAIIIQDIHHMFLSGERSHIDSVHFKHVIQSLIKLLKLSGSLTLLFDNKYSYIYWLRNLRTWRFSQLKSYYQERISIRLVRKILKREGFHFVNIYIASPSINDAKEMFNSNNPPGFFPVTNIKKFLGNVFLYSRYLRFVSPAFVVSASRIPAQSLYENMVKSLLKEDGKGYYLRRLQPADQKVILSIQSGPLSGSNVVVKLPLNDVSLKRCSNNRDVLRLLHKDKILTGLISAIAKSGNSKEQPYFIEEFISGVVFDSPSQKYLSVVEKSFELLIEFHQTTLSKTLINDSVYDEIFEKQFEDLFKNLSSKHAKNCIHDMKKVEEYIRKDIIQKQIPLVLFHADYKAENLIFNPRTLNVRGIIDWDLAMPRGLPLLDVIHLLISKVRVYNKISLSDLITNKVIPMKYNKKEWDYLNKYVKALGLDIDLIPVLSIMYWIHHITYRVGPYMKTQKKWLENNVYKPLEKVKSLYL